MSKIVSSSLKTAVKGSATLVAAILTGQALWFLIRILIARNVSQFDFGIYSLAITIMSITAVVFTMSISDGTARYISVSGGPDGAEKREGIIKTAFRAVLFSGVIATVMFYLGADDVAMRIFKMPELAKPLKVIVFALMLSMMLDVLIAVFRGYGIIAPKATADLVQPLIYIGLLALIFLFDISFIAVFYAFTIAHFIVVAGLFVYAIRKIALWGIITGPARTYTAELILFSLPLSGVTLSALIMTWTDTLMLGYFMGAEDVGLYNVAAALARTLTFPILILNFVFMPIAGELFASGHMDDLKRTFQVLTKWLFMASFPVFLVIFVFPETTLQFLFGPQYEPGSPQLRILSLRFMLDLAVGPGVLLLTVFGRTRLLLWIAVTGSVLNIVLNYTLIPMFGLTGAAVATLVAAMVGLGMCAVTLYSISGIHPFTARYIKPAVASSVAATLIYLVAKSLPLYFWMMPIYFILFLGGYLLSILLTKSIEKEDIFMFDAITAKLGIELVFIKRVIRKFAHE